jgi:hypothetical protein
MGPSDLDTLGHHEGALELARRDAAVDEGPTLAVIGLATADDQLVVLLRDLQLVHGEPGDGKRDAQAGTADLLDVVRRIPVRCVLARPLEHLLEMVEAKKIRGCEDAGGHRSLLG